MTVIPMVPPQETKGGCCVCVKIFCVLGIITLMKVLYNITRSVWKMFFQKAKDFKKEYGDGWVVISGGSDGIGLAFANEFLKRKMKICLIARNENKLNTVKATLQQKYPESIIKIITFDFNKQFNKEDINFLSDKFKNELDNNIAILYNNVGHVERGLLHELKDEQVHNILNINITATTFLTKIALISMVKRQKSLIFFSGAVMGQMRFATRQIYSSAKSYIESFSECLEREYPNIDFTCFNIGPVYSNFNRAKMPFMETPESFAEQAINKLGYHGFTSGTIKHEIFWFIFWYIPLIKGIMHKKMSVKPKVE